MGNPSFWGRKISLGIRKSDEIAEFHSQSHRYFLLSPWDILSASRGKDEFFLNAATVFGNNYKLVIVFSVINNWGWGEFSKIFSDPDTWTQKK